LARVSAREPPESRPLRARDISDLT